MSRECEAKSSLGKIQKIERIKWDTNKANENKMVIVCSVSDGIQFQLNAKQMNRQNNGKGYCKMCMSLTLFV